MKGTPRKETFVQSALVSSVSMFSSSVNSSGHISNLDNSQESTALDRHDKHRKNTAFVFLV